MKLLTFLGVANYQETCYTWQGQEYTSRYAPAASCHFLKLESLTVFLTEDAEQQVYPDFKAALPEALEVNPIPVPLGVDEGELWRIFDQVSSVVQPGEAVAFDITHGLRSFPLIGLLASAFLRAGLGISLEAVLYGTSDIGKATSPGKTPMFDLSPMISLLEWAAAADRFNRTGDARYLASLVEAERRALALAAQGDQSSLGEIGRLGNLAGALTGISQSLRLIRPHQAMEQVAGLPGRIEKARPALERAASARPFSLLLEEVIRAYQPLAHLEPTRPANLRATLQVERRMIHWYIEREQWVQGVSLAREWLVSWVMLKLNLTDLTHKDSRQRVEQVVAAEARDFMTSKQKGKPYQAVFIKEIPWPDKVLDLWLTLTDVRNDIDHAGMRAAPGEPAVLIERIQYCAAIIEQLPV